MNFYEIIIGLIVFTVALPVLFLGAPFLPSYIKNGKVKLESLFNLLRENSCKKFMDLGSGDGRVVIDFAKAGFESYGVEINPLLVLWSKLKIKKLGLKNAKIKWGNIWPTDLSGFDSVFIFQYKTANKMLAKKFKKELKTGAIVISAGFPLEGIELMQKAGPFLVYKI